MSIISNLIRKSIKKDPPFNILSFFYDGKFDVELLKTGHQFYGCVENSAYQWPGYDEARYENLHILPHLAHANTVDIDFVIFNHRMVHGQFFDICRQLHAPGLIIDHDLNTQNSFQLAKNKQATPFMSVSCSEVVQKQYDSVKNIYYGLEDNVVQSVKDIDILICGSFTEQDSFIINAIKQKFPTLVVVGHNQKLPYSITVQNFEEYKRLFQRANIFINLTAQMNINYDILFALKNRVPVVSNHIATYGDLLNNNNASIANSIENIIPQVSNLVYNKQAYQNIANYQTDLDKFNINTFVTEWNNVFLDMANKVFVI